MEEGEHILYNMKAFIVSNGKGFSTLARVYDDYSMFEDSKSLGLKEGQSLKIWAEVNSTFSLKETPYYNRHYTQEDKLEVLLKKNKSLQTLIETFDLEVS